jgi:filamentous hemagglutinin
LNAATTSSSAATLTESESISGSFALKKRSGSASLAQSSEIGSQIIGQGNIALQAGQDISARAATLTSGQGSLSLQAGQDIRIEAGNAQLDQTNNSFAKGRGALSGGSTRINSASSSQSTVGSSLSAKSITLDAGRDASVKGSSVIADNNVLIMAGRDVNITAQETAGSSSHFKEVKKSGVMGSGGFGVFIGCNVHIS